MIDSGAQQFSQFNDYPYSTNYYALWCNYMRADFAVSLDYPLDMFEYRGLPYNYRELLEKTVQNGVKLYELWQEGTLRARPILAIQGLRDEWFVECLNMYDEMGLLRKHDMWGIGSLCMSQYANASKILRVARMVRRKLGSRAWIHVFGPDINSWKTISGVVDSVDTCCTRAFTRRGVFRALPDYVARVKKKLGIKGRVKDWEKFYLHDIKRIQALLDAINTQKELV